MYGLKVNEISRAVVEREAYDSGRHFVGLGNVFERFKKSQREIVFLVDDPEREKDDGTLLDSGFGSDGCDVCTNVRGKEEEEEEV